MPGVLLEYLKTCQAKSLTWEVVEAQLRQSGWSPVDISSARTWYSPASTAAPATQPVQLDPLPTPVPTTTISTIIPATPAKARPVIPILGILIIIFLFLGAAASVSAYLVATDKINLKNSSLEAGIKKTVFSIPFVPKTPAYILATAFKEDSDIDSGSFDISLAVSSSGETLSALGLSNFDAQITGFLDASDPNHTLGKLSFNIAGQLETDVINIGSDSYVKINKLPLPLYAYFGIDPKELEPIFSHWIRVEEMDTPARRAMDSQEPESDLESPQFKSFLEELIAGSELSTEKLDGISTYKITFQVTPQVLDKLQDLIEKEVAASSQSVLGLTADSVNTTRLSQAVTGVTAAIWIDKGSFYPHQMQTSLSILAPEDTPPELTSTFPIKTTLVVKFSNLGQKILVEPPAESISVDEFLLKIYTETTLMQKIQSSRSLILPAPVPPGIN